MKTKILIALIVLSLIGIIIINSEYLITKTRSEIINSKVDENLTGNTKTNPLILLHGFNPTYSRRVAEFSLKKMQDKLAEDLNYVDKGLLIKETVCAELISENKPIIVRASYLNGIGNADIKSYSKNIGEIINKVKECTGAEKVDIITHSMGGIAVRNYLKDSREKPVRKLIMIATPNQGGLYNLGDFIEKFSDEEEASIDFLQLTMHSNFMQELNKIDLNDLEVYTIAGNIDGKGDGIIVEKGVKLEGSKDHITVKCNHIEIKNPKYCPEAYEFIKGVLNE